MRVADLLVDLERRGVTLELRGDRLAWRAPQGAVTPELVEVLARHKAELVELLESPDVCTPDALAPEPRQLAFLVRSGWGDEVLVVKDEAAAELALAEELDLAEDERRPVLLADDLAALRGKPRELVQAAVEVARHFPGCRITTASNLTPPDGPGSSANTERS